MATKYHHKRDQLCSAFVISCAEPRKSNIRLIHDGNSSPEKQVLKQYFQDLNRIFLLRFRQFSEKSLTTDTDKRQLQSLLAELIRLKGRLE